MEMNNFVVSYETNKCEKCYRTFKYAASLRSHMELHDAGVLFNCRICSQPNDDKESLRLHVLEMHTDKKTREMILSQEKHEKRDYKCYVCSRTFKHAASLRTHLEFHAAGVLFNCSICNKPHESKESLKLHEEMHTVENSGRQTYTCVGDEKYICNICNMCCPGISAVKEHVKSHTTEKQYECFICESKFKHEGALVMHMHKHTGYHPPIEPPVSGQEFIQSSHHVDQDPVHTDQKQFKITSVRTKHTKTHRRVQPYTYSGGLPDSRVSDLKLFNEDEQLHEQSPPDESDNSSSGRALRKSTSIQKRSLPNKDSLKKKTKKAGIDTSTSC